MPLSPTDEIVGPAARAGVGAGAFNVVQLEHAEAIVAGAEAAGRPVILQISENTARYHGGLEPIGLATLAVARAALVPVAVHLDHAESVNLVHEAVRLGFSSVMFDANTPRPHTSRSTASTNSGRGIRRPCSTAAICA
ncbi:class II fructose-bisphosphate aldolase, partial [Streptomyces albogriseolus]|uniref:class II fructose-bisphosphate aldolase n=1 Tax=Streptomyces albogriseolus TaxID=1887 RepID=UPI0034613007